MVWKDRIVSGRAADHIPADFINMIKRITSNSNHSFSSVHLPFGFSHYLSTSLSLHFCHLCIMAEVCVCVLNANTHTHTPDFKCATLTGPVIYFSTKSFGMRFCADLTVNIESGNYWEFQCWRYEVFQCWQRNKAKAEERRSRVSVFWQLGVCVFLPLTHRRWSRAAFHSTYGHTNITDRRSAPHTQSRLQSKLRQTSVYFTLHLLQIQLNHHWTDWSSIIPLFLFCLELLYWWVWINLFFDVVYITDFMFITMNLLLNNIYLFFF